MRNATAHRNTGGLSGPVSAEHTAGLRPLAHPQANPSYADRTDAPQSVRVVDKQQQ
jgi:hypothetical protein